MKKICFISFFLIISCVSSQKPTSDRSPQSETEPYNPEFVKIYNDELLPLIAQSIHWRRLSIEILNILVEKKKKNESITAAENDAFYAQARAYLDIRENVWRIVDKFIYLVDKDTETRISTIEPTSKTTARPTKWVLNPKDQMGRDHLFGLRISLTAALILYDNFLIGIQPHYENSMSRTKLKYDASSQYKGAFEQIVKNYFSVELRQKLARAINLYSTDYRIKNQYQMLIPNIEENLNAQILDSPFYNFMLSEGLASNPKAQRLKNIVRSTVDFSKFVTRATTYAASFVFGNSMGVLQSRNGNLIKKVVENPVELAKLKSKLQPFDILLEKTPFRATDTFIPGYYGHVAIYMGTEEQLRNEGLWDKIKPEMQAQISKGENILEALRYNTRGEPVKRYFEGVQLNSLEHFLNVDEMLVLRRVNPLTDAQKKMYTEKSVEQYGKPYDFNFDVTTKNRIVCSELAFVIFTDINWPTAKSAGRFTISPDHVMAQALPGRPLKPVLMYDKNGTYKEDKPLIPNYLANELYRNIQGEYTSIAYKEESIFRTSKEPQELIHLASGIAALQKRLEIIRGAKNSIDLEYFIYKTDTDPAARMVTQELIKKAKQNQETDPSKKIRIRILIDASATVLTLKDDYATVLKEHGIQVRYYNASEEIITNFMKVNQRNHRKSLIVDGKEAIIGGRNIGAEYFDLSHKYNFLDTDIYIKGDMATVLDESFEAYWYSPMSAEPYYILPNTKRGEKDPEYIARMSKARSLITVTKNDQEMQASINSWGPRLLATQFRTTCHDSTFVSDLPSDTQNSRRTFATILDVVKKSTSSLDIESPYFVITDKGRLIFKELLKKPNYKLSIQTNSLHSTDASYTVAGFYPLVKEWTQLGVDMYIYKGEAPNYMEYPKFEGFDAVWGTHSKRAVVDGKTTLIGTYNVDPRSTNLNNEMVYICHNNEALAQDVLKEMKLRQAQSARFKRDGTLAGDDGLFDNATKSKKVQYFLLKKLVEIPALRELL
ncbi:MAG: hypothetical protein JNL11_08105 [Bdellovibrionaceae bacterium]|nr:hypothetical protein [Pseudobdellovibrionaceae bacterium]